MLKFHRIVCGLFFRSAAFKRRFGERGAELVLKQAPRRWRLRRRSQETARLAFVACSSLFGNLRERRALAEGANADFQRASFGAGAGADGRKFQLSRWSQGRIEPPNSEGEACLAFFAQ